MEARGREIWRSVQIIGDDQQACSLNHSTNMVSCDNWSRTLTMTVTSQFVPGDYLLKLTASNNRQSYILLTIWQTDSHATYLVMNRSMVEQGWNTFGGYDFYQGQGVLHPRLQRIPSLQPCPSGLIRPPLRGGRVVRLPDQRVSDGGVHGGRRT